MIKKALHAVPFILAASFPITIALNDPFFFCFGKLMPRGAQAHPRGRGYSLHLFLVFFITLGLPRSNGSFEQTLVLIRDDQTIINPHHASKAAAGFASPERRVIGKGAFVSGAVFYMRSEEHTSELQSRGHLVCR